MPKFTITSLKELDFEGKLEKSLEEARVYSNKLVRDMSNEVIKKAQNYITEGRSEWDPLYNVGDAVGESTMKWWAEGKTGSDGKGRRDNRRDQINPLQDTGDLFKSIKIFGQTRTKYGSVCVVGSDSPYAHLQEFGGANPLPGHKPIPARPFLLPAIIDIENESKFKERLNWEFKMQMTKILNRNAGKK